MVYTFANAQAPSQHKTQYFEMIGNRAIYHDGWVARTIHKAPWEAAPRRPLDQDIWELYNVEEDFAETNDLATKDPQRLKELQDLFMAEAEKYNVLPIDDRSIERFDPKIAGRPDLMDGRTSLTVYEGMTGMMENAFINVKNNSLTITAEVEIPKSGANGVILCQGGKFGGWSLYMKDGKPAYAYNWLGLERYTVSASKPLAPGKATIVFDFAYDGGGRGKGGIGTLSVNGRHLAKGRIGKTQANVFSLDDAADVGVDEGTPVTKAYKERNNKFTGKIHKVTIELKDMKTVDRQEEERAHVEFAHRKALAD
jgi:arylsulfatase